MEIKEGLLTREVDPFLVTIFGWWELWSTVFNNRISCAK